MTEGDGVGGNGAGQIGLRERDIQRVGGNGAGREDNHKREIERAMGLGEMGQV